MKIVHFLSYTATALKQAQQLWAHSRKARCWAWCGAVFGPLARFGADAGGDPGQRNGWRHILGVLGLGVAIPLIAIAYATRAGFARSRDWVLAHIGALKQGFAWLILLLGIAVLFGADK